MLKTHFTITKFISHFFNIQDFPLRTCFDSHRGKGLFAISILFYAAIVNAQTSFCSDLFSIRNKSNLIPASTGLVVGQKTIQPPNTQPARPLSPSEKAELQSYLSADWIEHYASLSPESQAQFKMKMQPLKSNQAHATRLYDVAVETRALFFQKQISLPTIEFEYIQNFIKRYETADTSGLISEFSTQSFYEERLISRYAEHLFRRSPYFNKYTTKNIYELELAILLSLQEKKDFLDRVREVKQAKFSPNDYAISAIALRKMINDALPFIRDEIIQMSDGVVLVLPVGRSNAGEAADRKSSSGKKIAGHVETFYELRRLILKFDEIKDRFDRRQLTQDVFEYYIEQLITSWDAAILAISSFQVAQENGTIENSVGKLELITTDQGAVRLKFRASGH